MKIGILGGTFDPIHIGHLIVGEEARVKLGLKEVLFVPTGQPWLKAAKVISPARHRLAMISLGIRSNPYFRLSTVEVDREGPSYTVETVVNLHQQLGPEAQLYFIVGFDSLAELPLWKEPERLVESCILVGVKRPGHADLDLTALERSVPGCSARILFLEAPLIGISSTDIRQRVTQGLSIRYLVPEGVERYIRKHHLYKKGAKI